MEKNFVLKHKMYEFSIYNPSFFGETVCFVLPTAILRISSGKKTTAGSLA